MKILKYIIILILLVTLTTCKKYPQGGWTNVAIKHLFGGNESQSSKTWKLKLYEVNGIDSTKFILSGNGITNFENSKVEFSIHNARAKDYYYSTKIFNGNIHFNDQKTTLSFVIIPYNCVNSICERNIFDPEGENAFSWVIEKLKKNELILTGKFDKSYKIILNN